MIEIRWQEQYERMKRYLARASEPMSGADREAHNQRVLDDLASFFVFCFHLKDWLKGDPQSGIGRKEVRG